MTLWRAIALLLALGHSVSASAAELSFFCTDALASSARELIPQFERVSGHSVKTTVENAGTIAARLERGESPNLGIVLPPAWDRLKEAGRIDPTTRIIIGKVGIGGFVRRGAEKPDFSTAEAFKQALLNARKLAIRDPAQRSPVGTYMLSLFERLQISDVIKSKLMLTADPPYEEIIRGDADLGFSTLAEIAAEPRAELAGPLPGPLQTYNVFITAVPVGNSQREITTEFIRFLTSENARRVLTSKGLDLP
jgi:molybdate transport system substrate-binding protein